MKTLLNKKLCFFIPIAIGMFFFSAADAQIVYTDVKPDSVIISTSRQLYNLDLNNDGIKDFVFTETYGFQMPCRNSPGIKYNAAVKPASGSNNVMIKDGLGVLRPLDSLSVIDANTFLWTNDTINHLLYSYTTGSAARCNPPGGPWFYPLNKYLGLKFIKDGNTYYGWARLFKIDVSSMVLTGYAYNSIPNQSIRAGETSCITPTVTLKASGPLSFCNGDSVKFTANGSGYLYQWKKNGVNISGATSQTYAAKTAGTYKCFVTNSCGSITSTGKKVTVTCIELSANSATSDTKIISPTTQLQIAPNPFSNSSTISFSIPKTQKVSIGIFDMNGRLIKTLADAQMPAGGHQLVWNAKDEKQNAVCAGIYFLRMQTGNYAETKKIVVVK